MFSNLVFYVILFIGFLHDGLNCSHSRSGSAGSNIDLLGHRKISIQDALRELGMDTHNLAFTDEDVIKAFKKRALELHPFNHHGASKATLDANAEKLAIAHEAKNIAMEFFLQNRALPVDPEQKAKALEDKHQVLHQSHLVSAAKSADVAKKATQKSELEQRVAQRLREQKEADRLAAEQEGLRAAARRLEDQKKAAEKFSASPAVPESSFYTGSFGGIPTPGSSRVPSEAARSVGVRSSRSDSLGSLYSNTAAEHLNSYGRRLTIYEALHELKMDPNAEFTPKEVEERYLHRLMDYADDKYLGATKEDLDRREKSLQDLHQAKQIALEFHKMPPIQRQNAIRHAQEVERAERDEWDRAMKALQDKKGTRKVQDAKAKDIDPDL